MPRKASRSKKTAVSRPRRKKAATSPSRRKKSTTNPSRRKKYLVAAALLLAGFAIYLGYLNYVINSRFEGGAWALPSRVYARALELYPNLALTREQLVYELDLSSFLQVQREPLPGQYRLLGESLELHSRRFDFGDHYRIRGWYRYFSSAGGFRH